MACKTIEVRRIETKPFLLFPTNWQVEVEDIHPVEFAWKFHFNTCRKQRKPYNERYLQLTNQSIFMWAWKVNNQTLNGNLTTWPGLNLLWENNKSRLHGWAAAILSLCGFISHVNQFSNRSLPPSERAQFPRSGVKMLLTHRFVKLHQCRSARYSELSFFHSPISCLPPRWNSIIKWSPLISLENVSSINEAFCSPGKTISNNSRRISSRFDLIMPSSTLYVVADLPLAQWVSWEIRKSVDC